MLWKQLILAATAATGFLLVPETTEAEEEMYKALPFDVYASEIPATAMRQVVEVPCAKCKGKDSHLSMDIAVEDGSRLTLNGYELYPSADPWHGDLTASLVKANGKKKEQLLGYSLAVGPQAYDEEQSMGMVSIALHIIEVGGRFIEGIPTIDIRIIRAPTGDILIGDVALADTETPRCASFLCRLKDGAEAMLRGFGAHGRHGRHGRHGDCQGNSKAGAGPNGHHRGGRPPMGADDRMSVGHEMHQDHDDDDGDDDGRRPHHDGPHPHHHHPHGPARPFSDNVPSWGPLFKIVAFSIVLPVLTGITAGVGVALFVMGICSFAAMLVRARRANKATGASIATKCRRICRRSPETERASENEKVGLMDETYQDDLDEEAAPLQREADKVGERADERV